MHMSEVCQYQESNQHVFNNRMEQIPQRLSRPVTRSMTISFPSSPVRAWIALSNPHWCSTGQKRKLKTISITAENVKKALGKMRIDKAPGVDDMSPRLLVKIADCIVEPLCNIYNNSILDGIVPQDWKRANVCPVHKKGSKIVAGNLYRPISLTSQLCKVFEFIMKDR